MGGVWKAIRCQGKCSLALPLSDFHEESSLKGSGGDMVQGEQKALNIHEQVMQIPERLPLSLSIGTHGRLGSVLPELLRALRIRTLQRIH